MKNVNITDIREKLSEYIRYVLSGGTVVLWKHDKRVARIIPDYTERPDTDDSEFIELYGSGTMRPPLAFAEKDFFSKLPKAPMVSCDPSRLIIDQRSDRL